MVINPYSLNIAITRMHLLCRPQIRPNKMPSKGQLSESEARTSSNRISPQDERKGEASSKWNR